MILLDANILLYAYNPSFPHHERARAWLQAALSAPSPVGFSWATILAFIRIGTHPRAFPEPLTGEEATSIVSAWLAHPTVVVVQPTERHWEILKGLLMSARGYGSEVPEAHLAALAIEHGLTLCTTDRGFARFPGLQWADPLAPGGR